MKIGKWNDLVDAFIKKYKYNMDTTLDRSSLQYMDSLSGAALSW